MDTKEIATEMAHIKRAIYQLKVKTRLLNNTAQREMILKHLDESYDRLDLAQQVANRK